MAIVAWALGPRVAINSIEEHAVKKSYQRRRLFIDRPIQMAVLLRTALYWAMCTMAQVLLVLFFGMTSSAQSDFPGLNPHVWWHLQVTLLASVALLPLLLRDVLKLSHRWVGPMFRLRLAMRALSRGEPVPELRFRDRDFWHEMAEDLNAVAAELEQARVAKAEATKHEESELALSAS